MRSLRLCGEKVLVLGSSSTEAAIRFVRLFAFNFLLFAGFALLSPFFVLYLQSIGFTGAEIGVMAGITPLVTFFGATFWTGLADLTRRHRLIMTVGMAIEVAGYILFPFLRGFLLVMPAMVVINFFFAPVPAFADNAAMFMLGEKKEYFGRIRLGGTIGFALAGPLAGVLIGAFGLRAGFWSAALAFLLALFISRGFVHAPSHASPPTRAGIRILLSDPRWILFLIVSLSAGMSLAAANNYLLPFMKELGAETSTMGIALAIGAVTEIPMLFFGHHLLRRLKPHRLFMLAMAVTAIRLLLFGVCNTPALILLVQLLCGFAFSAMWIAGVAYTNEHAPEGMSATAQALFGATVVGFGTALGGFLGGILLGSLGGRGVFLIFGCIVMATVLIAALLEKRLAPER
jgi:PPP family 3-phenylpropionic acid transporter